MTNKKVITLTPQTIEELTRDLLRSSWFQAVQRREHVDSRQEIPFPVLEPRPARGDLPPIVTSYQIFTVTNWPEVDAALAVVDLEPNAEGIYVVRKEEPRGR